MWGGLGGRGKDAVVAMREWGMAPRMFGGGMLLTLSDIGLVPRVDVIQVPRFDAVWPPADTRPVRLRRVTLEDVFKQPAEAGEGLLQRLFRKATLEVRRAAPHAVTARMPSLLWKRFVAGFCTTGCGRVRPRACAALRQSAAVRPCAAAFQVLQQCSAGAGSAIGSDHACARTYHTNTRRMHRDPARLLPSAQFVSQVSVPLPCIRGRFL